MTNKQRKDNKIIAEFMGVVFHDDENQYYSSDGIYMVIHQYHTSWDWLMPVCQKIDQYLEDNIGEVGYFDDCLRSNDIDVRYQAVLEFINSKLVKRYMESNKVIAEFMDLRNTGMSIYEESDYKYHESWDWLMPVVEKIEQVHEGVPKELIHLTLFSTIDEVYRAVIKFINQLTIKTDE